MEHHSLAFDSSVYFARTLIVCLVVLGGFRLLGKRQLGQLNLYDLAMIMALSNAVQNAMTGGRGALAIGIACAASLLTAGRVFTLLFRRYPTLEARVLGVPSILIQNGKLITLNMRREGITEQDLLRALREHGLEAPEQAELGILEVDGSLSVVPKEEVLKEDATS